MLTDLVLRAAPSRTARVQFSDAPLRMRYVHPIGLRGEKGAKEDGGESGELCRIFCGLGGSKRVSHQLKYHTLYSTWLP